MPVLAREQGTGQREGGAPLGGREVAVAAGQGQTVVLADGGDADDLHAEVQVPDHAADQGELLGVLLAVQGDVGTGQVQQLGDDREHAVEVARAGGALQALAHGARGDADLGLATGVHLVHGGGEHDVRAGLPGELEVGVQGARVAVEVLALTELQRVDEDGDDDLAVPARDTARGADQRGVALVQCAHGHHHGAAARPHACVQFAGGAQQGGGHRASPSVPSVPSVASASTPRRSSASSGFSRPWARARSAVARAIAR